MIAPTMSYSNPLNFVGSCGSRTIIGGKSAEVPIVNVPDPPPPDAAAEAPLDCVSEAFLLPDELEHAAVNTRLEATAATVKNRTVRSRVIWTTFHLERSQLSADRARPHTVQDVWCNDVTLIAGERSSIGEKC